MKRQRPEAPTSKLKNWADQQPIPFTLDQMAMFLGIDPDRITRDLAIRMSADLRYAGCVRVAYKLPNGITQVRWASASMRANPNDSWTLLPPPARAIQGEHQARLADTDRIRLAIGRGLLPIGADESACKAHEQESPSRLQRLSQWLADVAQWFHSFPLPR